jgi:hypothetical protein
VAISLLCLLAVWTASAAEVLVKVHLADVGKLPGLVESYTVRFRGESFLLVQGDEEQFAEMPLSCVLLDRIRPDALYYLVRIGQTGNSLPRLTNLGSILLRFGDSILLRIEPPSEPRLISLGLPLSPLPESIRLHPYQTSLTAPRLRSQAETAVDIQVVGEIVNSVSADKLREIVYELQENKDFDPPYTAYRSRYCLRVKETDDPSDDACDNAAEYIFSKFESYGLDVEYDIFPHEVLTQGHYEMRNVVATLPGKGLNCERVFLITSHYDTIASKSTNWWLDWKTMQAPGADDNASGTAAVLEAARILSEYDFDCTVKFVAFSGEELGLHGSKHYAKMMAENGADIAGVMNFDMIAYDPDELDIDIITNMGSEWIVDAMLSVQQTYSIGPLFLKKIVNSEMVYSDHAPFWNYGYNSILGIDNSDFDSPEFYPDVHTTEDTIDKLNFDMAATMVQIAAGTLARLADPLGGSPHSDLAVAEADIRLSPENPHRGQQVQVTANIYNVGKADADDVRVQVWLVEPLTDAPRMVSEEIVDVQVDGCAQISASLDLTEWGDYQVLVKANPDYQIFETNGGNNIAGKPIHISSTSLALGKLMLYPNPVRSEDNVNVAYTLSKDAATKLEVYDTSGNLVYRTSFSTGEPGGMFGSNNDVEWDATNLLGEKVSGGIYFCCIVATDERGETKSISRKLLIIR